MTDLQSVLIDLDQRHDVHLDELDRYVSIPSVSSEDRGMREAAEHIRGRAAAWGLETALLETGGQPALLLRGPRVDDAPRVLIYGHYDVQPAGSAGDWLFDPFRTTVHGGRVYGRGTADNKGQHLAHLLAIESWIRLHGSPPCNVTLLLDGEEEVGSPNLADLVRRNAELLACDLVVWSDGPVHESGRATMNFGVRGIVQFELIAHGAAIDLHSGNWGGVGPNPAWELVHLLASMKNAHGLVTIDGFTDDVTPLSAAEARALEALPVDDEQLAALGIGRWDEPAERPFYDRLAAHPTLTISRFETGASGGDRAVIPAMARAVCDVRLVDAMTVDTTYERIADHVRRHAPDVRCTLRAAMEPSRTDLDSAFVEPIRRALRLVHGEDPYLVPAMGGSLPDYVFTKILGVPSIGVPFANADEANHAPNENIELHRYLSAPKIAAALLSELSRVRVR
ncbi:M20/M25/M40 family metallo-hydrolase [Dactylosporangium maewongense]|uniref:M20/M25/M40 family metallo-hydrolase n=1 Tax=Dactylosporangium maewongense TaxID=634393 RepID=A0ABP4N7M9_9ACTN